MELNKCAKCGKLFPSNEDLCSNCLSQDLQDLETVRKFLLDNPKVNTIEEICNETGVTKKDVLRYISKGRFDDITHLGEFFTCIYCKKPIKRGRYCDDCLSKFHKIKDELSPKT
ncbi:MAG: MerR family transcriptional regulator [Deltaproteobacteria bacterium]